MIARCLEPAGNPTYRATASRLGAVSGRVGLSERSTSAPLNLRLLPHGNKIEKKQGQKRMLFGAMDHLDLSDHCSIAEHYENRLKLLELYDAFGFYGFHTTEHHCTPLGGGASPSVFLSAAAQRTKTLRLGTFVYVLPLHHPIRLAEEIAMVDQLSNGRIELGFGRGSVPMELDYFGID